MVQKMLSCFLHARVWLQRAIDQQRVNGSLQGWIRLRVEGTHTHFTTIVGGQMDPCRCRWRWSEWAFVDNNDGWCSRAYGALDGICFMERPEMGLGEMGKAPHSIHQVRKIRKKDKQRREKEIPVLENNLLMMSPAPYMGFSTGGLST